MFDFIFSIMFDIRYKNKMNHTINWITYYLNLNNKNYFKNYRKSLKKRYIFFINKTRIYKIKNLNIFFLTMKSYIFNISNKKAFHYVEYPNVNNCVHAKFFQKKNFKKKNLIINKIEKIEKRIDKFFSINMFTTCQI